MLQKILVIIGYIAVLGLIVLGTLLLVAYGKGYIYDFKAERLVQRGLVLLDSVPSGAKITLDGRVLKQKTPYRQNFEGGTYSFSLSRDGYRDWHKNIDVTPSEVSFAQYITLLPQHFNVDTVSDFAAVSQVVTSRDRRRAAVQVPTGRDIGIWSVDTQSRNLTKLYTPPTPAPGQAPEADQILSWSYDASHLLIQRTPAGAKPELIIVASNGSDTPVNLNTTFGIDIDTATFSQSTWRELYWTAVDGLHRLNLNDQTVSAALAPKVGGYTFDGDRLIYVDTSQPTPSLWAMDRNGRKQRLVASLPISPTYQLGYSTYINVPQAVVVAPGAGKVILYSDIYNSDNISSKNIDAPATDASFNSDGRFILLHDPTHVSTYDLERSQVYRFPQINSAVTGLSWFDNYHVLFNRAGQIVLAEYDSNYAVVVTRGDAMPPLNSIDDKFVMATSPTSTGTVQLKAIRIRQ